MSKTISGIVTWLRNWFYTKQEVDSLISTGGGTISIEDTDLFDVLQCVIDNFDNFGIEYFFEDDASADNTSTTFGSSINLRNGGNSTVTWNNDGYYLITQTASQRESMIPLLELTGTTDNFCFEYDSYCEQTGGSSGFVIYNSVTNWCKLTDDCSSDKKLWWGYNTGSFSETALTGTVTTYQKWLHYKYTVKDGTFKMEIFDGDTSVFSYTATIPSSIVISSSTQFGIDSEWQRNTKTRYKNLVAYNI